MRRQSWLAMSALLLSAAAGNMAQSADIQQFTVARNDNLHESWPDVAITANGDLVVAYQESESHGGGPTSTIVSRFSTDQGATWSEKTVVARTCRTHNYQGWLNGSKILRLQDDSLMLVVDNELPHTLPAGSHHFAHYQYGQIWLYRSFDNGRTWYGPEVTTINGGIVPSLVQLSDGTLLIGITQFQEDNHWRQYQRVFRSSDNGKTWEGPITVGLHPKRQPNEGDFVELDTGEVVCYMRDDEPGVKNGLKAISKDGGRTWGPLYGSGPWVYAGRPDVGRLSTGEVLLTTRVGAPQSGQWLGFYVESRKMSLEPTPLDGPMTEGAAAGLIENDTNPIKPDWGYSGWVELANGSVYVVQYITADAPAHKPLIRGYLISRSSLKIPLQR